ncbi:CLC-B [Symbiodinium microadriaticum]|nr:CLC-B [Symbiodinium sp. KB8]CAE7858576.1 CLC-B [Symbiodinium microadriaticum]
MAVDAAGDSLMDAATQPIADDDGEGDDEESPLTHASRAVHAAEGVDGVHVVLQREDLHARSEALRDAAIAAEAPKAATTSTEVLPLSGPNPYAIAAAASASNPVSASGPLSLPVNARKQRERLESPEKKHRTDKKKIETGTKFPGGDLKPHLSLEGEDQGGLMLRPRQLPMTPSLSDIPKFSTLTLLLPRLFRVGLEIFGTCLLEVQNLDKKQEDLSKAQGDMVARSKFARVELLYTGGENLKGAPFGLDVGTFHTSKDLMLKRYKDPPHVLDLIRQRKIASDAETRLRLASEVAVARTGAADLLYFMPRIEMLGCKSCLRGSVSGGTEDLTARRLIFWEALHAFWKWFLIRKADFSEAKYFEHLPVQVEHLAGQTRSRAPGPLPPPSPPQIPGAVSQYTYVWGLVDQQILMQVCTVLFTLLVVALVKQVTAWWQGNSTPKVSGRKHAHGSSPMPATAADPDAEGGQASTAPKKDPDDAGQQKTKEDTRVPDKTTVTADGSSPKTSAAPSSGTTVPSGPQTTATSDDKKAGNAPAATTSDPKTKSGVDGPTGGTTVTPHSMLQEIQAVHKLVKTLIDGGAPPDMKKVNGEMENLRKDVTTIMKFLSSSEKDLKDVTGRLAALETVLGSVNSRVCTLSTNLDIHAKSTESYLKEALKSISVVGGAAKTFHADTQVLIGAKHDNLEQGIKSCINKVTNCDYETHTALSKTLSDLSKQTYDMGQELLAALHFVQSEQGTTKDNLWQIANVLADTVEQVKIIRDYCERPVPVNVQNAGGSSAMPPPPTSIHGPRQQLHLQTAIPAARGCPVKETGSRDFCERHMYSLHTQDAAERRAVEALHQKSGPTKVGDGLWVHDRAMDLAQEVEMVHEVIEIVEQKIRHQDRTPKGNLLVRAVAVILSNATGFPVGREGPTVTMGSNMAFLLCRAVAETRSYAKEWVDLQGGSPGALADERFFARAARVACVVGGACHGLYFFKCK